MSNCLARILAAMMACSTCSFADKARGWNGLDSAGEPGQRARMGLYRAPAEVLDEVVVQVDPVQGRASRVDLVKIAEIVVDEVGQRFSVMHGLHSRTPRENKHLAMVH